MSGDALARVREQHDGDAEVGHADDGLDGRQDGDRRGTSASGRGDGHGRRRGHGPTLVVIPLSPMSTIPCPLASAGVGRACWRPLMVAARV